MKRLVMIVAAALSFAGFASPAQAGTGMHCSFQLVPTAQEGTTTTASLELIGCFANFEQALEAGTGATLALAAGTTPESLTEEALPQAASFSSVLIGTEWTGTGYTGPCLSG